MNKRDYLCALQHAKHMELLLKTTDTLTPLFRDDIAKQLNKLRKDIEDYEFRDMDKLSDAMKRATGV